MTKLAITAPAGLAPSTSSVQHPYDFASAIVVSYTTFAADLATLVADGASPTQAHVNAVNSDWTSLKAVIDGVVAKGVAAAALYDKALLLAIDDVKAPAALARDILHMRNNLTA